MANKQDRPSTRRIGEYLVSLARVICPNGTAAPLKGWTVDNNPIYGGVTLNDEREQNAAPDAGCMNAGRIEPAKLLYAIKWATWFIEKALQRRWLIKGPTADNAMRLALKEIEQFHSTAYPSCVPDAHEPASKWCPAHEAMCALKEALGDE